MVAGRHAGGDEPAETTTVKALLKRRSSCLSHFTLKWNNTAVFLFPFVQVMRQVKRVHNPRLRVRKRQTFLQDTLTCPVVCLETIPRQ